MAALVARRITELSGGERQLVQVARALAQEAPVLILDEPTASLDFGNRARVLAELDRLRGSGLAIVFSTHEPDQRSRTRIARCCWRTGARSRSPPSIAR